MKTNTLILITLVLLSLGGRNAAFAQGAIESVARGDVLDAAWDLAGNWLFIATTNGIQVYDALLTEQENTEFGERINSIDVTETIDFPILVTSTMRNQIKFWNFDVSSKTLFLIRSITFPDIVEVVRFEPNGNNFSVLYKTSLIESEQFYTFSVGSVETGNILGGFNGYILFSESLSLEYPSLSFISRFAWISAEEAKIIVLGQAFELQNGTLIATTSNGVLVFSALNYQLVTQIDTSSILPYYAVESNPRRDSFALSHTYGVDLFHCCDFYDVGFLSDRYDNYALAWDDSGKILISNVAVMNVEENSEVRFPEPRIGTILRWRPQTDEVFFGGHGSNISLVSSTNPLAVFGRNTISTVTRIGCR